MSWFVYILQCGDNSLYTGVTTDVIRRFKEHQRGKTGAKYTRSRTAIKVLYTERCISRSEAQVREAAIKKLTKAQKISLISSIKFDGG